MMRLPKFEYIAPATMDEAVSFLDRQGRNARILAGGTDLLVAAKLGNCRPRDLVSLKKIDHLKGIMFLEKEGLTIGSMTPLFEIRNNPWIREHYPALAQAAAAVGTPSIQRMGTLGGNLCLNTRCHYYNQSSTWRKHRPACLKMGGVECHVVAGGKRCFAVFSADTPPVLTALDADIKLIGKKGERVVPVNDFYSRDGKDPISIGPGEILTGIRVPPPDPKEVSVYLKFRLRKAMDFPLAGVAVRIVPGKAGECLKARIVLNASGSSPIRVTDAETLLEGGPLSKEAIAEAADRSLRAAHPVANAGSTPSYRRKMAGILTRKALAHLSEALHPLQ